MDSIERGAAGAIFEFRDRLHGNAQPGGNVCLRQPPLEARASQYGTELIRHPNNIHAFNLKVG
jgi:hypothetical protein